MLLLLTSSHAVTFEEVRDGLTPSLSSQKICTSRHRREEVHLQSLVPKVPYVIIACR